MHNGRAHCYGGLGFAPKIGLGQFEDDYAWQDSFDSSYGFDPFMTNATTGDVPTVANTNGDPATSTNWLDNLITGGQKLATAYLTYEQAKDINALNMELIRQGKPPISQADIAPQVRVGVAPDTQKILLIAALGVGALFVVGMVGGRKRGR